jgi:hypothetical protein
VTAFIDAAISCALSRQAWSRGGALDRRQGEFYRAFAARSQDAFETKPHRGRVAEEGELDPPARQRLGLTRQQCRGGKRRLVARADPAPGVIARPALREPPAPVPRPLFPLFYLVEIRHPQLLQSPISHPVTDPNPRETIMRLW